MKQSCHLGKTLRDLPKDAQTKAQQLLLRAGFIKQLSAGIYVYMPLLFRTIQKISEIIREELLQAGFEELLMPALQPGELWVESGRWSRYTKTDGIMFAFQDRRGGMVCLGPTHEEVATDLVRREVESYKDLPLRLFQIQTKFRDEIRPRFGLIRAREFVMKDAYSFDLDAAGLDQVYMAVRAAYHRICQRIGFSYRVVEADSGSMGGADSEEFMVLAETGEDSLLCCQNCSYAANQERAESLIVQYEQDGSEAPMKEVLGVGLIGVEKLAEFLQIPVWKTTKTIIYQADDILVAVLVRGDCEVNELKVRNYLNCDVLNLVSADVIRETTGADVGYAGPIGLPATVKVIADHYVSGRVNFECGANRTNYHNVNVNFGRDLVLQEWGDFKLAEPGHLCPRCNIGKLQLFRGIEVGHVFKLGTKYADSMSCYYCDKEDKKKPVHMGCYGLGVSRIAAAFVEMSHDQNGIVWSPKIAPYQIHLIGLNLERENVAKGVEEIYGRLQAEGLEVLYDDRPLRAGEKFADSDLIGLPVRVTVGQRSLEQGLVEFKLRWEPQSETILFSDAITRVKSLLN